MKKIFFFFIIAVMAIICINQAFADCNGAPCPEGDSLAAESSASSQIYFFNGGSGKNDEISRVLTPFHQQASGYLGYSVTPIYKDANPSAWTKIPYWRYDQLTPGLDNVKKLWGNSGDTMPQSMGTPAYIPYNTDGIFLLDKMPHWDVPVLGAFWNETVTNAMELEAIRRILSLSKAATNTRYVYLTSVKWTDMANSLNGLGTSTGTGKLWSDIAGGISLATNASTTRARGFAGHITVAICFADIPGYAVPETKPVSSAQSNDSVYIAKIVYGQKGADNVHSKELIEEIKLAIEQGIQLEVIGYDLNGKNQAENQAVNFTAKIVDELPWENETLINNYFFINSFQLDDEKEKINLLRNNMNGFILIKQLKG